MPPHAAETMIIGGGDHVEESLVVGAPKKNVTFAINYEVSLVDEFVATQTQKRVTSSVESVPGVTQTEPTLSDPELVAAFLESTAVDNGSTTNETDSTLPSLEGAATQNDLRVLNNTENNAPNNAAEDARRVRFQAIEARSGARRSTRDNQGKREVSLARTKVKYDMQIVPKAHRSVPFLQCFPIWWLPSSETKTNSNEASQPARRTPRNPSSTSKSASVYPPCSRCQPAALPPPFLEDTSVVWVPSKRSEWEDSVSELTAVCTSAALHRHMASTGRAKPFHAPLSRAYIRDRVDIDDPLNGYQIRHKSGGWLQGFCLWTNFTTWTHHFRWDSKHPQSGIPSSLRVPTARVDRDGSLAQELEALPREGDPHGGGIVFSEAAEVSLVGGLGCGEYLLRMAMDDIRSRKKYRFVVLQATESSKAFYERFGFVRVGAICRYQPDTIAPASGDVPTPAPSSQPIVGYRHWTHANESDASLQMHGGPSYMMCVRLPPLEEEPVRDCPTCANAGFPKTRPSFLKTMLSLAVAQKPTIEQLGGASTPAPAKHVRRGSNASALASDPALESAPPAKKRGRKPVNTPDRRKSPAPVPKSIKPSVPARNDRASAPPASSKATAKRRLSGAKTSDRPVKRHKPSGTVESTPRETLFAPPTDGKSMSYAQKQYQSPWLAVPPTNDTTSAATLSSSKSRAGETKKRKTSDEKKKTPVAADRKSPASKKKKSTKKDENTERMYYSVRGPDGRFVRVPIGTKLPPSAMKPFYKKGLPSDSTKKPKSKSRTLQKPKQAKSGRPKKVDRTTMRKQKVKAYPRARVHYYNRVVKPASGTKSYYFVLEYDEAREQIRVIPMASKGSLMGKREGRPRYQCVIGDTDANFELHAAADFQVVRSTMVMKTPIVALEAWDIEDDD